MCDFYTCNNCEAVFDEYALEETRTCLFMATRYEPAEYSDHCPACGSTDYDEFTKCVENGCSAEALPGSDHCRDCWEKVDPEGFAEDWPAYAAANLPAEVTA